MSTRGLSLAITPLDLARSFWDTKEISGRRHNPQIVAFARAAGGSWIADDETPWCAAFIFYIALRLGLSRPDAVKGLAARQWLLVGEKVNSPEAGFDLVILSRGGGDHPPARVISAPGHVGFFVRFQGGDPVVFGGNQTNAVTEQRYPRSRVLGYRRLVVPYAPEPTTLGVPA